MVRGKPADFWQPLQRDPRTASREAHQLNTIARLRSGVTLAQAAGRVDAIAEAIGRNRCDRWREGARGLQKRDPGWYIRLVYLIREAR
jgi:hypothetical protein